jgi:hypothetical protein
VSFTHIPTSLKSRLNPSSIDLSTYRYQPMGIGQSLTSVKDVARCQEDLLYYSCFWHMHSDMSNWKISSLDLCYATTCLQVHRISIVCMLQKLGWCSPFWKEKKSRVYVDRNPSSCFRRWPWGINPRCSRARTAALSSRPFSNGAAGSSHRKGSSMRGATFRWFDNASARYL